LDCFVLGYIVGIAPSFSECDLRFLRLVSFLGRESRRRRAVGQRSLHGTDRQSDTTRVCERWRVRGSLDDGVRQPLRREPAAVLVGGERWHSENRYGDVDADVPGRPVVLGKLAGDHLASRRDAELSVALLAAAELEESAG
jgi:hypothetical protein